MRISVVIVNYHSAAHLKLCLKSLKAQRLQPFRVLIINNGDNSTALSFVRQEYPDYILLESNNIGFAAANNLAIATLTDSEWLALLNPDAFPDPDWLEKMSAAIYNNKDFDFFSSELLQVEHQDLIDGEGDSYHFSGMAWRKRHGLKHFPSKVNTEVFSPCCAAALFPRSLLVEVGGFDERFFCYFEDVDLGFRLRLAGYRCLHVSGAVVRHVGSASSGGKQSDFSIYFGHRNMIWTFVKNMPGYLFWLFLPVHICMNLLDIIVFSLRGKGYTIIRSKFDALKGLGEVWEERRKIQERRKISPWAIIKLLDFQLFRSL